MIMRDDITFCASQCDHQECFRHSSNIKEPKYPHSFAYFAGTEDCPMRASEKMTKERAIELLEEFKVIDDWTAVYLPDFQDALDYALKILKETK